MIDLIFNLDIYNLLDIKDDGLQRCLIPSEYFSSNLSENQLVKCKTNETHLFICFVSSMQNRFDKKYCFMDDSVQIGEIYKSPVDSKLISITPISKEVLKIKSIDVELIINSNLFNYNYTKTAIIEIVKEWLCKFILHDNCIVNGNDFLKNIIGIDQIIVKIETIMESPYQVDNQTKILITNVLYKEKDYTYCELKCLNYVDEELDKIITDFMLQKKLDWQTKFTFNTLLIGSNGSGKTSLCHNLFYKNKCNVFNIKQENIFWQHPGESEEALRNIYENVKYFQKTFKPKNPTVIFIENIDTICPMNIPEMDSSNISNISSQIYSILDDINMTQLEVILIATTSQIDNVNNQLRRNGRLTNEIQIHIPNTFERKDIFQLVLNQSLAGNNLSNDFYNNIAEKTQGYVGADLKLLVQNTLHGIIMKRKTLNVPENEMEHYFEENIKKLKASSLKNAEIKPLKCSENFDSIGGADDLKKTLKVSILTPLKNPEIFKKFGLKLPKGILLYGPPGCAKTTIAKCIASETNMTFISVSGAEVYSPYIGNAEKYIVKIFDTARRNLPCLIFFDEIETLVGKRTLTSSKNDVQSRILSTLLQEMDGIGLRVDEGIKSNKNENHILVIGATNRPDIIDDALLRPGRFDKLIHVPAPDAETRLAIFNLNKKRIPFDENVNFDKLVEKTELFSGADISNLCNEAALHAFTMNEDVLLVTENDFDEVLKEVRPSLSLEQVEWYKKFSNKELKL